MSNPLHQVFVKTLQETYDAENQILQALPELIQAAQDQQLKQSLQHHVEETKEQIGRLDQAFQQLNVQRSQEKCVALQGLIQEARKEVQESAGTPAGDAVIIASAQKTEHYEISNYGTLATWAQEMGHDQVVDLLRNNQREEREFDEELTRIAESRANVKAQSGKASLA